MNPFAQNPVEFADNAGIRLAGRMIATAYRRWGVNPVVARHAPRAALIAATITMALIYPAGAMAPLVLAAAFTMSALGELSSDLPSIRAGWNASAFRSYSAKAMKEREDTLFRRIMLCAAVIFITAGTSIAWSSTAVHMAVPFACFLVMELGILFKEWMAAAELPEPDDGDFAAAPQTT
ncbi:hypothetical protein D3C71_481020 [compost metagenome]